MAELLKMPVIVHVDGIEFVTKVIQKNLESSNVADMLEGKSEDYKQGVCDYGSVLLKVLNEYHTPAAGPPLTNADKLRNMTDEELADWLMKLNVISCDQIDFCQCKEWCIENISNIPPEHHKQCLLEWLKGSAE